MVNDNVSLIFVDQISWLSVKFHVHCDAPRGGPNFCFGYSAKCGETSTFGGHLVLAESSQIAFSAL